uniref:Serpin domain-containing protein n=1 Tax=Panagrolaimus superbus TaxID=310955 RepID=A0A914Z3F2_9BILA
MSSRPLTKADAELMEKLRKLRGGSPSPPPRPSTPFSDIPAQLKSEIIISSSFLNSCLNAGNLQSIVFSPAIISASLIMALYGADKEAIKEINDVFGQNLLCDNTSYESLIYFKSLIYSKKLSLLPPFTDYCNKNDSHLFPVDFDNLGQTIKEINSKVSEKTMGLIANILNDSQNIIIQDTSLCVASAATFVGQWAFSYPFDKPKSIMFYSNPPRQIDMIRQKEKELWMFSEGDDWTCMSIIYGEDIPRKLYIILPKKVDGLANLIKKFDYSLIRQCINGTNVLSAATIPLFQIKSTMVLNDKLKDMGIKHLFSENAFDKIISNDNPHGLDLFVHAARIKVDQFGADGRDDTADHLRYEDLRIQPGYLIPPPGCEEIEFVVDRPFIFFVALWKVFEGQDSKPRLHSIQFTGIFS